MRPRSFAYNGYADLTGTNYPTLSGSSYTRSFTNNTAHDILTETYLTEARTGYSAAYTYDANG